MRVAAPLLTLLLTLPLATPAWAQALSGRPERLHGTVVNLAEAVLTIRTDDQGDLDVTLPPGVRIGAVVERSLADIRPGEFVGSAAVRGRDGRLHAQEVHIFPETMRGTGEGHRPMEEPGQTMTNATVNGVVRQEDGRVLHLQYPGGEQAVEVGPDVRVVGLIAGDRALLVPGAAVTVRAIVREDGTHTAVSIQAEKDGVKPLP